MRKNLRLTNARQLIATALGDLDHLDHPTGEERQVATDCARLLVAARNLIDRNENQRNAKEKS